MDHSRCVGRRPSWLREAGTSLTARNKGTFTRILEPVQESDNEYPNFRHLANSTCQRRFRSRRQPTRSSMTRPTTAAREPNAQPPKHPIRADVSEPRATSDRPRRGNLDPRRVEARAGAIQLPKTKNEGGAAAKEGSHEGNRERERDGGCGRHHIWSWPLGAQLDRLPKLAIAPKRSPRG